jgi:ubiquinone/menaquinone biosynthesis C-methylase UbiE
MVFDEGLATRLDAMYRTRDMVRRRRLARTALGAAPGEHILDVGCGPGFYVAELLEEVGAGGRVAGPDASTENAHDARGSAAEQRQLSADGEFFFCCVQFCFTAVAPTARHRVAAELPPGACAPV